MQKETMSNVNADILTLIKLVNNIGWPGIRKISVYRIMYLASVLFSFKHPDDFNPFSRDYTFIISLQGPYSNIIDNSLIFLETNQFIASDSSLDLFKLGDNSMPVEEIEKTVSYSEKHDWIQVIIYILGIYGEEKVYDFVFRDPEYQSKVQSNLISKDINISKGNKTHTNLLKFKEAFEKQIGEEIRSHGMDDKVYLELYFRYVFSKILKGELIYD